MIFWIIGLSGAGKTTIGRALYDCISARYPNVVHLDGDNVRRIMGNDLRHTREDRRENGNRVCRLCKELDDQDIHVVASILSLFEEHRAWNRENLDEYVEVFVDVPLPELKERDPKRLYAKAEAGDIENVVGYDIPFEEPQHPDVIVDNTKPFESPEAIAQRILDSCNLKLARRETQ